MRINICQNNYDTLAIEGNKDKIKQALLQSENNVLNIFGEFSLSGSPLYNKNLYNDIYTRVNAAGDELCMTQKSFIIGTPSKITAQQDGVTVDGEVKEEFYYNSLVFVDRGEVKALATKRNLGRFDDNYSVGNGIEVVEFEGKRIAFGFYEDIFNFAQRKTEVSCVILVSNVLFDKDYADDIEKDLSSYAKRLNAPVVFVSRTGAEGNFVYQGGSFFMNRNGEVIRKLDEFEEQQVLIDTDSYNEGKVLSDNEYEKRIFLACVTGIRDYWRKSRIKKAVIGLSGGIDSAVVAPLGVAALGKENVIGVLMPSEFSSLHSVDDALQSAGNLGIEHYTIHIQGIFEATKQALAPLLSPQDTNSYDNKELSAVTNTDTTEENLQARARCMIVMAFGNRKGAAMLNTSNKSESAVGYGTLYGDDSGALGPVGDLYKEDVYKLARWINKAVREGKLKEYFDYDGEYLIPLSSIEKAPSAELKPNQKDSDTLPEYEVLDKIIKDHIENHLSPEELIKKGYNEKDVKRILHLYGINEWKRRQEAPALRLSKTCFATDFKINY